MAGGVNEWLVSTAQSVNMNDRNFSDAVTVRIVAVMVLTLTAQNLSYVYS